MGVLGRDDAVVQDQDPVGGVQDGGAAGDDDGGAAPAQLRDVARDELFGDRVDGRGRVVQDQDVGVGGQGAGQGKALALPPERFAPRSRTPWSRPSRCRATTSVSMDASTASGTEPLVPDGSMFVRSVPAKISPSYGFTSMCSRTASTDRPATSRPLTRTAPS